MVEKITLEDIIGSNNLFNSPDVLEEYSRDLSFALPIRPKCIVKPGNADEVQQIVKWANATLTSLVPVSSGPPHFRGDTIPGRGGAVIVDLSRMKRIIRVDSRNRVALIEPGVTYGELQAELEKVGLCAYMPLVPRSSKSVIASMLEREPTTMPAHHWDCTDPMLCSEVIFGTGDKMRTGEAAGPDTIEEQWEIGKVQITPYGLTQFDENRLISGAQGTIGVITWATLKCRPLSKLNSTYLVPCPRLQPLVDLSYQLMRIRLGDYCFILNGLDLACMLAQTLEEIEELKLILPPWVLIVSFEGYGVFPARKVEYQEADFKDIAQSCRLEPKRVIPGAKGEEISELLSKPSTEPYWKLRLKGGGQDIFFLTTLDKTPEFTAKMSTLANSCRFPIEDIGVYIQPTVQGTSCHCEFSLYYEPKNSAKSDKTKWLVNEGSREIARMGGFFSRPYGAWANFAYGPTGQTVILQKKVKEIFDPNGILNPGKLCF